jgi:hypothetical protein
MTEALRVGLFSSHASMTSEKGSMMEDLSLAERLSYLDIAHALSPHGPCVHPGVLSVHPIPPRSALSRLLEGF